MQIMTYNAWKLASLQLFIYKRVRLLMQSQRQGCVKYILTRTLGFLNRAQLLPKVRRDSSLKWKTIDRECRLEVEPMELCTSHWTTSIQWLWIWWKLPKFLLKFSFSGNFLTKAFPRLDHKSLLYPVSLHSAHISLMLPQPAGEVHPLFWYFPGSPHGPRMQLSEKNLRHL